MVATTTYSPASRAVKDHEEYWADNAHMLCETKKYRGLACFLAERGMMREGIRHPWTDNTTLHGDTKVRVVDFSANTSQDQDEGGSGPTLCCPQELDSHLNALKRPDHGAKTLIVIEGMDPRMLEVVGVKFGVPATFFLGHCDEFIDMNVIDWAGSKQSSSVYWKVATPQTRGLNLDALKARYGPEGEGVWTIEAGNSNRWEVEVNSDTARIDFWGLVSYWAIKTPKGWTAIVLVDPRHARLRRTTESGEDTTFELCDFDLSHKLFCEATVWAKTTASTDEAMPRSQNINWDVHPSHRSHRTAIFDDIDCSFQRCGIPWHTADPLSSTVYIRNFIRSAWDEWIFRWRHNLHDDIQSDNQKQGSASPEKKVEAYQSLMNRALGVKDARKRLRGIVWAFRCEDDDYRREQMRQMRSSSKLLRASTAIDAYRLESRTWAMLQEKLDLGEQDICQHMDMYAQRAALQQAKEAANQTEQANQQTEQANKLTAEGLKQTEQANKLTQEGLKQTEAGNRMARSSGQLTKIATVIVPCSFVASIFSMGDQFAAGKSLFYVYWLISMPITVALLFWVMCGNRVAQIWKDAEKECAQLDPARSHKWLKIRIFWKKILTRSKSSPGVEEAEWAGGKKSA